MRRRNDLAHREIGDWGERVRLELKCRWAGPGTFHDDVFQTIIDELEDAGAAIDMRDDLDQVVGLYEARVHHFEIERLVLEAHSSGGDAYRTVVERTDQRVFVDGEGGLRIFLGEAPKLAPTIDRRPVVQEHGMSVAALLILILHRNNLA